MDREFTKTYYANHSFLTPLSWTRNFQFEWYRHRGFSEIFIQLALFLTPVPKCLSQKGDRTETFRKFMTEVIHFWIPLSWTPRL